MAGLVVSTGQRGARLPVVWSDISADEALRVAWPGLDDEIRLSSPLTRGDTPGDLYEASFIVARAHPLNAADFERMHRLVGVTAWGVGHNHIDLAAATSHGIPVAFNPVFTTSVAEAALTLMLALFKRLPQLVDEVKTGRAGKPRGEDAGRNTELDGKTVVIVGFGRVGRRLGDLVAALGMRVLAVDPFIDIGTLRPHIEVHQLADALPQSDIVVLVLPLTAETRYLIGAAELAMMRPTAFLVNVGRGGLVDEAALLTALRAGRLAGAGIDTWEHEPPEPTNPLVALPNVIGTSHALARTRESLERICRATVANVQAALAGHAMSDVLNPEAERRQQ